MLINFGIFKPKKFTGPQDIKNLKPVHTTHVSGSCVADFFTNIFTFSQRNNSIPSTLASAGFNEDWPIQTACTRYNITTRTIHPSILDGMHSKFIQLLLVPTQTLMQKIKKKLPKNVGEICR